MLEGLVQYAIANAEKLRELWDVVNKDARATDAVRSLVSGVRSGLAERDPIVRLGRQLDAISEAIDAEAGPGGSHTGAAATTQLRRARAERIRGKIALAAQMPIAPRRKALQRLTSEVSALFAELVEDGLETPAAAESPKPVRKLPWQRKVSPSDF